MQTFKEKKIISFVKNQKKETFQYTNQSHNLK